MDITENATTTITLSMLQEYTTNTVRHACEKTLWILNRKLLQLAVTAEMS